MTRISNQDLAVDYIHYRSIASDVACTAGAGTAVGSVLAALQARPILPTAGRTGLSFAICFGCYAG